MLEVLEGFGYTFNQQGGIGYPPVVVKFKGRWRQVAGSRNHGGTRCPACGGECILLKIYQCRQGTIHRFLATGRKLEELPVVTIDRLRLWLGV